MDISAGNFWLDRPTFVTGGTGLVGGWLVRRLVEAGAEVSCLVRDWVPQSELVRTRPDRPREDRPRRRVRPGAARTRARRVRDRHRHPPRRADDRRHRQPQPRLDVRDQHPRHLGAPRSLPPQPAREAGRHGLVRQGLRRPGQPALRRGDAAPGRQPVRREQVVCGPRSRRRYAKTYGLPVVDHPVRQLLRRRRPELEPDRPRHDPLRSCAGNAP